MTITQVQNATTPSEKNSIYTVSANMVPRDYQIILNWPREVRMCDIQQHRVFIGNEIGFGHLKHVSEAYDITTHEKVAFIHAKFRPGWPDQQNFLKESQYMQDQNIISSSSDTEGMMITHLYEKGDLFHCLFETDFCINKNIYLNITASLLDQLKSLHEDNIVHRDIKLENILVDKDDSVALGDFELSENLNNISNQSWRVVGTPRNWSPEFSNYINTNQIQAAPETIIQLFKGADVWAMGQSLFILLHPILDQTFVQSMWNQTQGYFERLTAKNQQQSPRAVFFTYAQKIQKLYEEKQWVQQPQGLLEQMIWGALHPDPTLRLTVDQMITLLKQYNNQTSSSRATQDDNKV